MFQLRLMGLIGLVVALAAASAPAALLTFEEITQATSFQDANGDNRIDRPGAITSLVGSIDGITVTIRRQNNEPFDIIDNAAQRNLMGGMPKGDVGETLPDGRWGNRSLDPFYSLRNYPSPGSSPGLIIDFSAPVRVVSLLLGDYDTDPNENDFIRLRSFSQTNLGGTQLAMISPPDLGMHATLPFNQTRVTVTGTGIRSVLLTAGGSTTANFSDLLSVFVDRIYFDANSTSLPSNIDDEFNNGDDLFGDGPQSIPEPTSIALAMLTGMALLTRRPRRR